MGLDVYLYEKADYDRSDWLDAEEYGRLSDDEETITDGRKLTPEEEAEKKRVGWESTQIDSKLHPDHYCGPRYLRSSYNESGFNRKVHNYIGKDLYWVFEPPNEELYHWLPSREHLIQARHRATQLLDELRAVSTPYAVIRTSSSTPCQSEEDALDRARRVLSADHAFTSFLNGDGLWFTRSSRGLALRGVLTGLGVVYLVFEEDEESFGWYVKMAEIVIEFIDEALTMKTPIIVWSG